MSAFTSDQVDDIEKYNAQNETYHIGAPLKDLDKKWFAFSKLEKSSVLEIFKRLEITNLP